MNLLLGWLLHAGINGVVIGAPLCLVCRWLKSPAIRHALMLVVFVAFLAPPLWSPGITLKEDLFNDALASFSQAATPVETQGILPMNVPGGMDAALPVEQIPLPSEWEKTSMVLEGVPARDRESTVTLASPALILSLWAACGMVVLFLALVRIARMEWAMRGIPEAPVAVVLETAQAARAIGLNRLPRIVLHPGQLAPMIWAVPFRVSLLLPKSLWDNLDPERRRTILLHELAHVRRGDYLVRWMELLLAVLCWWHPVYYWARSILRDAEEESCDGLVLEKQPELRAPYAHALMDVVDYLNEIRFATPGMASGIGTADHLKRRLDMILRGFASKNLSRWAMASLLGGGLILGSANILPRAEGQDAPRGERPKGEGDRPKDGPRPKDAPKDAPRGEIPRPDGDRPRGEGERPRPDGDRPREGAPRGAQPQERPREGAPRGGFDGPRVPMNIGPQQVEQLARGMHDLQMQMQQMQMQMQQMRNEIMELRKMSGGRGPGPDNRRDNPPPLPREGDRRGPGPDNRRDNPPPPPREGDRPGAGERKAEPRGEQPRREGGERKPAPENPPRR